MPIRSTPTGVTYTAPPRRGCRIFLFSGLAVVLAAAVAVAIFLQGPDLDKVEARWRELAGFDPLVEYPPRDANEAALRLEELAARLGLELAPQDAPGRAPDPEVAARFETLRAAVRDEVAALRQTEPTISSLDPEIAEFLDEAQPALGRIAALLESDEPRWSLHMEQGAQQRLPGVLGHLLLHDLLILSAGESAREGLDSEALAWLETAWRLRRTIADDPLLIHQLVAISELKEELAMLRTFADPPAAWLLRLDTPPLRAAMARSLRLESWLIVQQARTGSFDEELALGPVSRFLKGTLLRHGAAHIVEAMERTVRRASEADLRTFEPGTVFLKDFERIPRWSLVARILMPNFLDAYAKAARTELDVDLTRRVLELRALLATGDRRALAALPARRPSVTPEIDWLYEVSDGWVVLRASDELPATSAYPLPLVVRLRR